MGCYGFSSEHDEAGTEMMGFGQARYARTGVRWMELDEDAWPGRPDSVGMGDLIWKEAGDIGEGIMSRGGEIGG